MLDVLRIDGGPPVGVEKFVDTSVGVGLGEATISDFFAKDADDAGVILIEDDDGDAPAEVFEILADPEEIEWEVIVECEVGYLFFDLWAAVLCLVLETATIAYFGVEALAGGKGFVLFDFVEDIIWHAVVGAPWHDGCFVIYDERGRID